MGAVYLPGIDLPQQFNENYHKAFTTAETEESSIAVLNQGHPAYPSINNFNTEPETQVESPIIPQISLGNEFEYKDSLPPTLHRNPHDEFPSNEQPVIIKEPLLYSKAQVFPHERTIVHDEESLVHNEKDSQEQKVDTGEPISLLQEHLADPEQLGQPSEPELTITFDGYQNTPPQCCEFKSYDENNYKLNNPKLNIDIKKEIEITNVQRRNENIKINCNGSKPKFIIGKTDDINLKWDQHYCTGETDLFDHQQDCPNDSQTEEDCGKIKISPLQYKSCNYPQTEARNFDAGQTCKVDTVNPDNNGECKKRPFDVRNAGQILSKEQFNELKHFLRDTIKNHKPTAKSPIYITKDDQDLKCHRHNGDDSCCNKCLNKLCNCLHLAKNVGDFISDKASLALRGLGGLPTKVQDCDVCPKENRKYSLAR